MKTRVVVLLAGLVVLCVAMCCATYVFMWRYEITGSGNWTLKVDRYTGDAWYVADHRWTPVQDATGR